MDFFDHQDRAHRNTRWLVFYFVCAVILIICSVYVAVSAALFGFRERLHAGAAFAPWDLDRFLWIATATLTIVAVGSLYKIYALSEGGEAVARWLGGRPIDPNTQVLKERQLLNVVEEMAISSGVPVPSVFLLEESGINAFAAGFAPADAVIGVTRGAMELLSRDELQGVMAHEFSHILNGDMRLNLRLMGVLNGILVIAVVGYMILRGGRFSSRRRDGGTAIVLLGVALLVIGWVGVFFGKLIKAAVSRQREFLADASAVQFTRNPDGIAGALKKIGGLVHGSRIDNARAEEASHFFFSDGAYRSLGQKPPPSRLQFMATHPPLTDRIRRIDPSFDGKYPAVEPPPEPSPGREDQALFVAGTTR
ncbi:MAG: M48 family metallopeptidase [Acidobacteriota bacterium]